jgi:hypothetical protein
MRPAVICVLLAAVGLTLFIVLRERADRTDSRPKITEGIADSVGLERQDKDIARYTNGISEYSSRSQLERYRPQLVNLLRQADTLHRYAHNRCQAAIHREDHEEALAYWWMHSSVTAVLESANDALGQFDRLSPEQVAKDTEESLVANERRYDEAARVLASYSQQPESIGRFREDPSELDSLLKDSSVAVRQARVLLTGGDAWGAWITNLRAYLDLFCVSARLARYETESYGKSPSSR